MLDLALLAVCAPAVHPTTMQAIVQHESRANPYAIGVNGGYALPRQPRTKAEAVATAQWLKQQGYSFDSGAAQINDANWQWLGLDAESVFDPCTNLQAAQTILQDNYARAVKQYGEGQKALQAALSAYNTGNFTAGVKNGYVQKVAAQLAVPALLPVGEQKSQQPVKLKAKKKEEPQGMPDAFRSAAADAFTKNKDEDAGRK